MAGTLRSRTASAPWLNINPRVLLTAGRFLLAFSILVFGLQHFEFARFICFSGTGLDARPPFWGLFYRHSNGGCRDFASLQLAPTVGATRLRQYVSALGAAASLTAVVSSATKARRVDQRRCVPGHERRIVRSTRKFRARTQRIVELFVGDRLYCALAGQAFVLA